MKIVYMDDEKFADCKSLLTVEAARAIENGVPYCALLLTESDSVKEDYATGAIAGRIVDDVLLIESLYVEEAERRKGGGRLLFNSLVDGCADTCHGIRVCFSAVNEELEGMADFFHAMGFRELDGGFNQMYLARLGDLAKTPLGKKHGSGLPFAEAAPGILRELAGKAELNGWPVPMHGFFSESVDTELSMLKMEGKEVEAYAVVERLGEYLSVSAVRSGGNSAALLSMLSAVWKWASEREKEDCGIVIHSTNVKSYRLVERLFPKAKKISHTLEREIFR